MTISEYHSEIAKKSTRLSKYNAAGLYLDPDLLTETDRRTNPQAIWFDSKAEAKRYVQLRTLEKLGVIEITRLQPKYQIVVKGVHICTYQGDFEYAVLDELKRRVRTVLEDVKGMVTDVYNLKQKLMKAEGHIINEIPAQEIDQWHMRIP